MLHTFKLCGRRIAVDSGSGTVHKMDELAFKMLDYIELPMPKDTPSALRYDLAKFDSAAIDDTYEELYAAYRDGKLYSEDSEGTVTVTAAVSGALNELRGGDVAAEALPEHLKEMEKAAKDQIKGMTVGDVKVTLGGCDHKQCAGCWAKKLCTLDTPEAMKCELERKFIECALVIGTTN
ncbi:MAG: hypothetical protein IJ493_05230 [Clostridia bacterium]|nr:hypothetical protein [Clostridia bacterium]